MQMTTLEKGTIIVEVHDKLGAQAPIAEAIVGVSKLKESKEGRDSYGAPECEGPTGANGRFKCEVEPGKYMVTCDAFLKRPVSQIVEVAAGCTSDANLQIAVGFTIASSVRKDDCTFIPCDVVTSGTAVKFTAQVTAKPGDLKETPHISWTADRGSLIKTNDEWSVFLDSSGQVGSLGVTARLSGGSHIDLGHAIMALAQAVQTVGGGVAVTMRRAATTPTPDLPLWIVIRKSTENLSFDNYLKFMNLVLCGINPDTKQFIGNQQTWKDMVFGSGANPSSFATLNKRRFLPYNDADAYRLLKVATEAFVVVNCGVAPDLQGFQFSDADVDDLTARVGVDGAFSLAKLQALWNGDPVTGAKGYLEAVNGFKTILYLKLIRDKLPDVRLKHALFKDDLGDGSLPEECFGILEEKLTNPCLLELIWSYWHEEGMLVQTLNALNIRFQNVRGPAERDPLAMLEIDPLRPLNNLMWGYIQDEQHRLTVLRRAYEYDHHYGLTLQGKAVPALRPADSRSKFLEEFHNLLYLCAIFFKEDDDTTVIADGFPVLNALKEVHFLLTEGAHNQFGDLPSTARQEMLLQQWLLARPEFREFLPTRIMVAYPEPWMDRVDAMKKLQGWTDASIREFHELAVFGEKILLSIRYGAWGEVDDPVQAANWARFWRAEIQGYTHSYRGVTGVDLTAEVTDVRQATERSRQPSVHLVRRLALQQGRDGSRGQLTRPTVPLRGSVPTRQRNP
jgi:hypothetical protein